MDDWFGREHGGLECLPNSTIDGNVFAFAMTYDDAGQLIARDYPSDTARIVQWNRDAAGFVQSVTTDGGASEYATAVTWNPALGLESWTSGAGITTTMSSDSTTLLPDQLTIAGTGFSNIVLDYTFGADDRLTSINTTEYEFDYDFLGRLTEASGPYAPGYVQDDLYFGYDAIGNLVCMDGTSAPGAGTCPGGSLFDYQGTSPHQASAVTTPAGSSNLAYTADGNLESHAAHGSWSFTYDGLGRVSTVSNGGSLLKTLHYRADGLAVRVDGNSRDTLRLGEDFEWDKDSGVATLYVTLGGQGIALHEEPLTPPAPPVCGSVLPALPRGAVPPGAELAALLAYGLLGIALIRALELARRRRRPVRAAVAVGTAGVFWFAYSVPAILLVPTEAGAASPEDVKYLHADRLGSSVYVSDETGALPTRVVYRPFGAEVEPSPGVSNAPRLGFTGQRLEDDIELYDYGARWYDPALGRFLQPDAFSPVYLPQGHNPYGYVRNDPVNLVDPTGNFFAIPGSASFGFTIAFGEGTRFRLPSGFGECGLFGLGGVNPFVSSCSAGPSIGGVFRGILDAVFPGAGGLVDSVSGQQTFCSGGFAGGTFCTVAETRVDDSLDGIVDDVFFVLEDDQEVFATSSGGSEITISPIPGETNDVTVLATDPTGKAVFQVDRVISKPTIITIPSLPSRTPAGIVDTTRSQVVTVRNRRGPPIAVSKPRPGVSM